MTAPRVAPRQQYLDWIEEQVEDYKTTLSHDELLDIAEEAITRLRTDPAGQLPLTEILLRDTVDALLFERLGLPDYRKWRRACRNDTKERPTDGTAQTLLAAS